MKEWKRAYRREFVKHLKKLIKDSDKKISYIAADGNAENKTIYRILKDENEPHITTVLHVAKGLGIHPKELYNFDFSLDALDPKNGGNSDSVKAEETSE